MSNESFDAFKIRRAPSGKFFADEKTARARLSGLQYGFAITDECNLARPSGLERRCAQDLAIASPFAN